MSPCPRCGGERFYRAKKNEWVCRPCANARLRIHRAKWDEARKAEIRALIAPRKSEWAKRNREKTRAHYAVHRALKSGELVRQPCAVCSSPDSESHHPDYSRPLEVVWLCRPHHVAVHVELNAAKRAQRPMITSTAPAAPRLPITQVLPRDTSPLGPTQIPADRAALSLQCEAV